VPSPLLCDVGPLPIGTWGKIRTYATHHDAKGKPDRFRANTRYRDFDGRTRTAEAYGRSAADAANNLRQKLKDRSQAGRRGELTALHRLSDASDLWMEKFTARVTEGRRSAGSLATYRGHLDNHVLTALGEVRLGEVTTPLVDKVIAAIKAGAGAPTAKTCRSVISGVMGRAVRYGAVPANPVREVERIEVQTKKEPRALTDDERAAWLAQLRADEKAVRKDLPDLSLFMLATGVRIGEALALIWSEVDLAAAQVEIAHTIIRVKGRAWSAKAPRAERGSACSDCRPRLWRCFVADSWQALGSTTRSSRPR
jgi:integrase